MKTKANKKFRNAQRKGKFKNVPRSLAPLQRSLAPLQRSLAPLRISSCLLQPFKNYLAKTRFFRELVGPKKRALRVAHEKL